MDHIPGGKCIPVMVFGVLQGRSSTWDLVGEELVVCLVLERDEGAANIEDGGSPGGVEDEFSDGVTLLWCRCSGIQTLDESYNQ